MGPKLRDKVAILSSRRDLFCAWEGVKGIVNLGIVDILVPLLRAGRDNFGIAYGANTVAETGASLVKSITYWEPGEGLLNYLSLVEFRQKEDENNFETFSENQKSNKHYNCNQNFKCEQVLH